MWYNGISWHNEKWFIVNRNLWSHSSGNQDVPDQGSGIKQNHYKMQGGSEIDEGIPLLPVALGRHLSITKNLLKFDANVNDKSFKIAF